MCEILPFFHSPAVVRKGTFLHNFFFSEYAFWSQVGASGVVYLSFLRIYGGSVFHGSQGSIDKREEIKMIFFWRCYVWNITIFSQPRGGQKRHFFAQFFFFWICILITGRCIWGGLFEFFENLWWKKW